MGGRGPARGGGWGRCALYHQHSHGERSSGKAVPAAPGPAPAAGQRRGLCRRGRVLRRRGKGDPGFCRGNPGHWRGRGNHCGWQAPGRPGLQRGGPYGHLPGRRALQLRPKGLLGALRFRHGFDPADEAGYGGPPGERPAPAGRGARRGGPDGFPSGGGGGRGGFGRVPELRKLPGQRPGQPDQHLAPRGRGHWRRRGRRAGAAATGAPAGGGIKGVLLPPWGPDDEDSLCRAGERRGYHRRGHAGPGNVSMFKTGRPLYGLGDAA